MTEKDSKGLDKKEFDIADDEELEDIASGVVRVGGGEFYFDEPSVIFQGLDKVLRKCINVMSSNEKTDGFIQAVESVIDEDGCQEYKQLGYIHKRSLKRIFKLDGVDGVECSVRLSEGESLTGDDVFAYSI